MLLRSAKRSLRGLIETYCGSVNYYKTSNCSDDAVRPAPFLPPVNCHSHSSSLTLFPLNHYHIQRFHVSAHSRKEKEPSASVVTEIIKRPSAEVFSYKKPASGVQEFCSPETHVTRRDDLQTDIVKAEPSDLEVVQKQEVNKEVLKVHKSLSPSDVGLTIENWNLMVSPHGRLKIRCPFNVKIVPLNVHSYLQKNEAKIAILARKRWENITLAELSRPALISKCKKVYHADVKVKDGNVDFTAEIVEEGSDDFSSNLYCILSVPLKYAIDIELTGHSNLEVAGLESPSVKIEMVDGYCKLTNLKAGSIEVTSKKGDILCSNSLQGNVVMKAVHGDVEIGKLQSKNALINIGVGNLKIKSLYAENSDITLMTGNMEIGSCHGNANFQIGSGKALIGSIDGNVSGKCKVGDMDVHISRHNNVSLITEKGDLSVSVEYSLQTALHLEGNKISVSPKLETSEGPYLEKDKTKMVMRGVIKKAGGFLKAIAKDGDIHLDTKDWFKAINMTR